MASLNDCKSKDAEKYMLTEKKDFVNKENHEQEEIRETWERDEMLLPTIYVLTN